MTVQNSWDSVTPAPVMGLSPNDPGILALSNSQLDDAYDTAFQNGTDTTAYGVLIVDRLASLQGFVVSAVGYSEFPLYQKDIAMTSPIPNSVNPVPTAPFNPVATAQTAVVASASNVASTVSTGVKTLAAGTGVLVVIALGLFIFLKVQ